MRFKKILLIYTIIYVFISCKSNIESFVGKSSLSASEAQTAIASSNESATSETTLINGTGAMEGLTSLQSLDVNTALVPNPSKNNFGSRIAAQPVENERKTLYNSVSKFILKTIASEKKGARIAEDVASMKGIYNYNWDTYKFDPAGSSDNIVFNFPDLANRSGKTRVNNCIYTVSTIETVAIPISETQIDTFLTKLTATLVVDDTKVLDLDYDAVYNISGILISLSEDATFTPYHIVYSFSTSATLMITENISKDDNTFIQASATKTLSSDTTFGVDKYIFSYKFSDILFSGSLDIKGLKENLANSNTGTTIFNVTDSVTVNKYYKTALRQISSPVKVGRIIFKAETGQVCSNNICINKVRMMPYVLYADSTSEKLENRLTLLKKYWKL